MSKDAQTIINEMQENNIDKVDEILKALHGLTATECLEITAGVTANILNMTTPQGSQNLDFAQDIMELSKIKILESLREYEKWKWLYLC